MAKRDRKTSFGMVLPTQQELQEAEENRRIEEKSEELDAFLKEVRNTTFLMDKELSKKFRVHCLENAISASHMLNHFIEDVLKNGVDDKFNEAKIDPTSTNNHKVTYYIQRGDLNELKMIAINNDTTIREILTYYILKELNMLNRSCR